MSQRIERINELIKREVSQIFLKEAEFPAGVLVTVTRAKTSDDLNRTWVFVSVIPESKGSQVLKILNSRIYKIQQIVNNNLKMRPVPQIGFKEEKETAKASKIEEILAEIQKENR